MLARYINTNKVFDYLTGTAAQDLTPSFQASNIDLKGKQSDFHWKTFRNAKRVALFVKDSNTNLPTIVHTLMDHRPDDSPFAAATTMENFVLADLHPVTAKKIAINDLFKATKTPNYKLDDILAVRKANDLESLSPTSSDSMQVTFAKNAYPIPPFMLSCLTDCIRQESKTTTDFTLAACAAFQQSLLDSNEYAAIATSQTELDTSIAAASASTQSTKAQESKQQSINDSLQQLAEAHGLKVISFLLNFDTAAPVNLEAVNEEDPSLQDLMTNFIARFAPPKEYSQQQRLPLPLAAADDEIQLLGVSQRPNASHPPLPAAPRSLFPPAAPSSLTDTILHQQAPVNPDPKRTIPAQGLRSEPFIPSFSSGGEAFNAFLVQKYWESKEFGSRITEGMQLALLLGGSKDGLTKADSFQQVAVDIMKAPTETDAKLRLSKALGRLTSRNNILTPAMVKMIRTLAWSFDLDDVPGGLSLFHIEVWTPQSSPDNLDFHLLDRKKEFKAQLTNEEFKKLTSQSICIPHEFSHLLRAMETQLNILQIFLGTDALICVQYLQFIDDLKPLYQAIEILIFNDSKFPAQLYYRIDAILGEILSQLFLAETINQVPFHYLQEFDVIVRDIQFRNFRCPELPNWIKTFQNSNSKTNAGRGKKTPIIEKGRNEDATGGTMQQNKNVRKRIAITEKEFNATIARIPHSKRPSACIRWHSRGKCYNGDRCAYEHTHANLTKAQEDEIFEFLCEHGLRDKK